MKQFLFSALAAACMLFCTAPYAQDQQSKSDTSSAVARNQPKKKMGKRAMGDNNAGMQQAVSLAYTPTYSSQFVMGNPAYSQLVMNLVKDYENNNFSMTNAFADTAMAIFPDGKMVRGINNMVDAFKQGRATYSDPKINIAAVMPVRSVDRKEDWVLVWGAIGSGADRSDFHHIWRINRDGKVDFIQLFQGKSPAQQ